MDYNILIKSLNTIPYNSTHNDDVGYSYYFKSDTKDNEIKNLSKFQINLLMKWDCCVPMKKQLSIFIYSYYLIN